MLKSEEVSFEPEDLFSAHIAGMDAFAKGFKIANKMLKMANSINLLKKDIKAMKAA